MLGFRSATTKNVERTTSPGATTLAVRDLRPKGRFGRWWGLSQGHTGEGNASYVNTQWPPTEEKAAHSPALRHLSTKASEIQRGAVYLTARIDMTFLFYQKK